MNDNETLVGQNVLVVENQEAWNNLKEQFGLDDSPPSFPLALFCLAFSRDGEVKLRFLTIPRQLIHELYHAMNNQRAGLDGYEFTTGENQPESINNA